MKPTFTDKDGFCRPSPFLHHEGWREVSAGTDQAFELLHSKDKKVRNEAAANIKRALLYFSAQ